MTSIGCGSSFSISSTSPVGGREGRWMSYGRKEIGILSFIP